MATLVGFGRAVVLRCPACGGRPLFHSWFRMREHCPRCGLRTDRGEEGYAVGAYMFNIMAAELIWAALFVAAVRMTWPTPPWDGLIWSGALLMIAMPVVCYPFSKTVFLAFDLTFRPSAATGDAP